MTKIRCKAFFLILLSFYSFLITGCSSYYADPLSSLENLPMIDEKGFEITAKAFRGRESTKYLGHNLLSKGYQPIQIYLVNHTNDSYLFSPEGLSLPTASAKEVESSVQESVALKTLGGIAGELFALTTTAIKAASFFTLTFLIALPVAFFALDNETKKTIAIVAGGLTIAPGIVIGIHTARDNSLIAKDYGLKTASETTIKPHGTFNFLIFVPKKEMEKSLSIKLCNQTTKEILTLETKVY